MKSEGLTHAIIGAAMDVHSALGPGFLESIYKNALLHELRLRSITAKSELEVEVTYMVVELKAIGGLAEIHIAQALSYMKATQVEVGLIINFGENSLYWK